MFIALINYKNQTNTKVSYMKRKKYREQQLLSVAPGTIIRVINSRDTCHYTRLKKNQSLTLFLITITAAQAMRAAAAIITTTAS